MGTFEFWEKWGLELDDKQFANAFAAIGILTAQAEKLPDADILKHVAPKSKITRHKIPVNLITAVLDKSLEGAINKEVLIRWKFPQHDLPVKIAEHVTLLSELDPKILAQSWEKVFNNNLIKLRFQVVWYPASELIRPWFRLLFEAAPKKITAFIEFPARQAYFYMKWPLRLGYFTDNVTEEIINKIRFLWPSNQLTRTVRIDRENANCDVLLFTGSSSQLLRTLLETPVPQKTNLFIVRGTFEDDLIAMSERLSSIAAEGRASGFIFLNPTVTNEVLGEAFNIFVENLSHNQTIDVAASDAFNKRCPTDPVIFLSRDLATFQVEHILEKIHDRLIKLPPKARPEIQFESFRKMEIPVDRERDDIKNPNNLADMLEKYKSAENKFKHEEAAIGMNEIHAAVHDAEKQITAEKQQKRFLQEQTFIKKEGKLVEERRAFQRGVATLIRVRIGLPDEKWVTLEEGFPEEKLPKDRDEWNLTVVLSEPNHLKEPLRRFIKFPKHGPSTECEFLVQPGKHARFEGRLTVLHRGRILQTAMLMGRVVGDELEIKDKDKIYFTDILSVRMHIDDLEERRQFDLALVMNHTTDGRPRLTAIANDHAWGVDLTECKKITTNINAALSKIAKSVKDYSTGLDTGKNRELLVELANLGNALYWSIVEEQFKVAKNRSDIANEKYIQIVSTKPDAIVPFEFIYDFEAPDDDAKPCLSWKDALTKGTCKNDCRVDKIKYVCPLGFWGVSKVIERHDITPELDEEGKDFYIQSEPTGNRWILSITGPAVVAASEKVADQAFAPVILACTEKLGDAPHKAKDWKDWATLVQTYEPHVLLALTHTDGDGIKATLEIGGETIRSNHIKNIHVRPEGAAEYPLVALLGCDTSGTALEYGSHVRWFRRKGAGVVIGTIATVFGGHAAKVAEMLIRGLKQDNAKSERLGEVIQSIKQQALLEGMLIPLCIVAYGDADWRLK
ncbi:MAG: hypothetical protein E4H23_01455 [Chrysiogenales bacterium]|nr:MAG: hypothetical protein E4H23_01455 [Chrysiogenales bacterium]